MVRIASSKIKGINIKIGADTTGLDTALKNIEKSGKNATSELGEIRRALNQNKDSVILWQQKQEVLTKAIENSKEKTNLLLQAQKGIEQAFRDGDIDRQAYDKFKEKLQKATDKLNDLKSQQSDFEQKFQSGEIDKDAYDKFIDKVQRAEREVQGLENSQRSMEENVRIGTVSEEQFRAFQREIELSENNTRNFENQLTEASNRVEELGNNSDNTAENIDELGDELQESGEQAENSANGGYSVLGNVFANVITKGIELAWTALKNFTQDVVATGTEYESAISNVVAISGAMADEVALLQEKAEEMGATTKFTAAESAEAMSYMAMAGWKVNDMVSGLDGIMDLSAASGESLASVSDIVTDALTAFGLQASDSAHFADVLAAASSNANTNVAMMGETFTYAAPVAGALGFSIEDTAEAIGLMANSGIKASQAGTSLRTILTNMSGSIMLTGEKLGQFTVNGANADGTMRELSDILADLRVGWNQLSEAEQAANAEEIAGKNAMSGFLALMNSAPSDIEKLSTAIENADGKAKEMSETMLDNLQGDKTLFESAFDGVKIAISKELNPALRDLTQYATVQMPKIQKAIEPVFNFVTNAIKNVPKLIENLQKVTPVLTSIGTAVGIIGVSKLAENLINKLIPAVKLTYTAISAHPLIAVATAVTALTAGLIAYKNSQLDVKTESELLIEKHNEELQLLADKRQAIKDLNDAFYENVDGIQNQTDRTHDLWTELDKLADQYGNVQQKDQARAEYILNELNSALGTEYSMTGNQINNYRTLSDEIDNVITKKQAEMMLDAYLANSTEMTEQRIEARTDYEKYDKEYQEKLKIFEEAEKTFKELTGRDPSEVSFYSDNIEKELQSLLQTGEEYEAGLAMYYARVNAQQAKDQRQLAKNRYEATSEYFEKEDQLYEAYSLGQYDRMAEIIYAEKDLTSTTLDESATDAEQRLQAYTDSLEKIQSLFLLNSKKISQTSVDELGKELETVMKNASIADTDPKQVWRDNFKKYFDEYLKKGLDVSPMIAFADDLNMSPADLFDNNWREVIQKQRENGHDITDFLQLAINKSYKPEITFGGADNFNDYLWERLANGQDIEYLLDWGFSNGDDTLINSNEFQTAYRETIQKRLEQGLDVDSLLKWSNKASLASSEEFVDVFKKTVEDKLENGDAVGNLLEWGNTLGIDMG
ncbi:MAG: phage tail tape measure protein, partial [Ruminococcus sp.]|nr:phage tail tape measure protein [Ruminococcus sp.]